MCEKVVGNLAKLNGFLLSLIYNSYCLSDSDEVAIAYKKENAILLVTSISSYINFIMQQPCSICTDYAAFKSKTNQCSAIYVHSYTNTAKF